MLLLNEESTKGGNAPSAHVCLIQGDREEIFKLLVDNNSEEKPTNNNTNIIFQIL